MAEAALGLPAEGLERGGARCQAPGPGAPDCGRIPGGPGPFDPGPPGRGMPRLGHPALLPPPAPGRGGGRPPPLMQQRSRVLNACPVAPCRHGGHGPGHLDPAPGLEGLDPRREAPGVARLVACAFQTSATCRLCGDGLAVCLTDERRRRCGPPPRAGPAPGGRTPVGPPRRAAVVPQHKRVQPPRGRLQIPAGLFPRPPPGAERVLVEGRDRTRGEVPGAPEPGPGPGVPAVRVHAGARRLRHHRGRDHPADVVLCGQITRAPRPTRAGCLDQDQGCGLGLPLPKQGVEVTWPSATGPQSDDRGVRSFGDLGPRARLLVHLPATVKRARLVQG